MKGPNKRFKIKSNNESEKAFVRTKNMFGTIVHIMWKEQFVDPLTH